MIHNRRTSAEKIFSRTIGKDVKAGEFVWAKPDLIYLHDVHPLARRKFPLANVKVSRSVIAHKY